MDRIQKFLRILSGKQRSNMLAAYFAILENRLEGLDIAPLHGKKNWFRCRIGNVRIIFARIKPGEHIIINVDYRGDAYKKM